MPRCSAQHAGAGERGFQRKSHRSMTVILSVSRKEKGHQVKYQNYWYPESIPWENSHLFEVVPFCPRFTKMCREEIGSLQTFLGGIRGICWLCCRKITWSTTQRSSTKMVIFCRMCGMIGMDPRCLGLSGKNLVASWKHHVFLFAFKEDYLLCMEKSVKKRCVRRLCWCLLLEHFKGHALWNGTFQSEVHW